MVERHVCQREEHRALPIGACLRSAAAPVTMRRAVRVRSRMDAPQGLPYSRSAGETFRRRLISPLCRFNRWRASR